MSGVFRFQTDEDFRKSIVAGLRCARPQLDIQTTVEAGILHWPDPDVLAFAATQGRILLSHDKRTMLNHLADFLMTGQHSPGVIIVPQTLPIGPAIAGLLLVCDASDPEEYADRVSFLSV